MLQSNSENCNPQRAFIIVPVHNRKTVTLKCLDHLAKQGILESAQVVIVDDGSTDGTSQAIQSSYPQVHILRGDGNLWWTGAIEKGMRYAVEQGANYLIWLNDDTLPEPETVSQLLDFCHARPKVIVASQCHADGILTFGGQLKKRFTQRSIHAQPDMIVRCDALDGNLVCMPVSVVNEIGYPEGRNIPHYGGDNFYTWKAKRHGFDLYLLGNSRSFCRKDHERERWLMSHYSIGFYWKKMLSPKSSYYWKSYPIFCLRYWGLLGIIPLIQPYIKLLLITAVRILVPKILISRIRLLVLGDSPESA